MRRQKAQTDFSLRGQAGVSLPGARTRRLCCAPVENSVLHFAVGSFLSQHVIAGTLLSGSSRGEEVMLLAGRTASWVASLVVASLGACHQGCAGTSCCGGHSGEDAETAQACTPCGMPHFYLFIYSFQESGACPPLVWNLSLAGFGCARVHVRLQGSVADCPASAVLTA